MSLSHGKPVEVRVAIIGGGFAGLALAIGLQKHQHINVQVYEAAHKFAEIGAGVVLGPNSQYAMSLIDPRIREGYERRAAFAVDPPDENDMHSWMTAFKGQAPDLDQLVIDFKHPMKASTIHRAHFLEELVKLVDPERAHFGKRLDRIYEADDQESPLVLHFDDGTTANADVIIGADGVHSVVRKHILGPDHLAANALYTGTVIYRALVPIKDAKARLGDIKQKAGVRCGKNAMVMGFPMSNMTLYYIALISFADNGPWEHDRWIVPADVEVAKALVEDWDEFARNLVELLPTDGSTMAWSVWEMPLAPTFFRGRVAMIGDAAHASTPFQGAGAGQAIEDSLVLQQLLGKYFDPAVRSRYPPSVQLTMPLILQAYDTVRRFRSQKVVTTSREFGRILSGNEPGLGLGAREIRERAEGRQNWIWELDQQQQIFDAFQIFDSLRDAEERTTPRHSK